MILLLLACSGKEADETGVPDLVDEVVATVSEAIPTVVTVTWTTEAPSVGGVRWAGGLTFTEPEATTTHAVVVRGLRADSRYTLELLVDGEVGGTVEVTTGPLPSELPSLSATGAGDLGGWVAAPFLGAVVAPAILDPQGNVVWWTFDSRGLDTYRVRPLADGSGVVYNAASISGDPSEDSALVKVSWDGTRVEELPVPLLAHDFVELPDGSFAALQTRYGEHEGQEVRGDAIVRVDLDGTVTELWNSWDCFDPAVHGDPFDVQGWTFANALDYDPADGSFWLGMRTFSSIAHVDPVTRTCDWVFGDTAATFGPGDGSEHFLHQHQFFRTDDTLLVFDNDGAEGFESRVLEYHFDPATETADQVWEYVADPPVYTFVLGEPVRLADGGTVVTWSASGQIDHLDAAGELAYRVNVGMGYAFGFMTLQDGL